MRPIILIAVSLCMLLFPVLASVTLSVAAQTEEERHWTTLGPNRIALFSFPPNYVEEGWMYLATSPVEKMSLRGVYLSEDRGDTWTMASEGLIPKKRHYYTVLAISPTFAEDRSLWLFGHKTGLASEEAFGGMWESTDGGLTWTEIDYKGFPYREMTRRVSQDIIGLVLSNNFAEDNTMVAAAGGEGVYISHDRGRNWEMVSSVKDITNIYAPPNYPDEPFLALATTGSQVLISTDGGVTFETRGQGLPEKMNSVRGIAFSENFAQDRKMFCYGSAGVFASEDAGMTWTLIAAPEENVSIEVMTVIGDFVEYGSIAYGTDDQKIFLSDDMGKTFFSIDSESLLNYKIDVLAFSPDYQTSKELYTGSQDGIFRFGPARDEASAAVAQEAAANVEATRSARATAVSGMEFVAQQSDRVETGCVAYYALPVGAILVFALKKRGRTDDDYSD